MDRSNLSCNTKKPWTVEEDETLRILVLTHGTANWTNIGGMLSERTGKQCRERWHNHLNPEIKKGEWTEEEDKLIMSMQRSMGNQWAKITKFLPGRSDNAVKNRFHAIIRARSAQVTGGFDAIPSPSQPTAAVPIPVTAIKLEKWGGDLPDRKVAVKLEASSSFSGIPSLAEGLHMFGLQSLSSFPTFGGSWAPISNLLPVNQVSLSSSPLMVSSDPSPLTHESKTLSFEALLPVNRSSPTPSLKSLSPMTVDEEFLELWMAGSRDDNDNISVSSACEDVVQMMVEDDAKFDLAFIPSEMQAPRVTEPPVQSSWTFAF